MSDLALYGNRSDVREFAERLRVTLPGASKLSGGEVTALAQLSVAHNLDPFNGEAWMIPGSGLMVGIKGLRKAAQRQARAEGGSFWTEIARVEPEKYNAPKNAIVYECYLRDSVTTQAWARSVNALTTAGIPYKEAIEMLGKAPMKLGIGIASPEERSKMDIHQRARKRAEADAIKQRYQVDFGDQVTITDDEPIQDYVETTVTEVTASRPADVISAELGYDIPPEPPAQAEPEIEYPAELAVVTNSDGIAYVSLDDKKLGHMLNGIEKALAKPNLTDDQISQYNAKHDAIRQILAIRNGK
jgi:hypothetical protein